MLYVLVTALTVVQDMYHCHRNTLYRKEYCHHSRRKREPNGTCFHKNFYFEFVNKSKAFLIKSDQ